MISDMDETLRRLLVTELSRVPGCPVRDPEQITFDPPSDAESLRDGEARVNLYLHDLRENVEMRDESYRVLRRPEEGMAGRRRGPVHLDLSYLVTAYAGDVTHAEHRLLADVLAVLLRNPAAPGSALTGVLEGQGPNSVLLEVAQPDHLASADPAALWQALGGKLRPGLSLKVTAPFDPFDTKWTRVVREAVVGFGQGSGASMAPGMPGAEDGGSPGRRAVGDALSKGAPEVAARVACAGVVVDQETEQPIRRASVTADGWPDEEGVTDERGFFFLMSPTPGRQTLRVAKRGYATLELLVVVPPYGRPDQLEPAVAALHKLSDAEFAAADAARAESAMSGADASGGRRHIAMSGRLRFPDGRTAAHLRVRLGRLRATTDGDGIYHFRDLPVAEGEDRGAVFADVPGRGERRVTQQGGVSTIELDDEED